MWKLQSYTNRLARLPPGFVASALGDPPLSGYAFGEPFWAVHVVPRLGCDEHSGHALDASRWQGVPLGRPVRRDRADGAFDDAGSARV